MVDQLDGTTAPRVLRPPARIVAVDARFETAADADVERSVSAADHVHVAGLGFHRTAVYHESCSLPPPEGHAGYLQAASRCPLLRTAASTGLLSIEERMDRPCAWPLRASCLDWLDPVASPFDNITMSVTTSEGDILARAIDPARPDFSVEAARSISKIDFAPDDHAKMRLLAAKARNGTLTNEDRMALENYERVNNLLGILRSKARRSIKRAEEDPA